MNPRRRHLCIAALTAVLAAGVVTSCAEHPQSLPGPSTSARPPGPGQATGGGPTPAAEPPNAVAGEPIPAGRIDAAVGKLDSLATNLMSSSHIPGMAAAVVHDGKVVYAKGFGVRNVTSKAPVDANTVFPLASMSKPIGATVIAHQVGTGALSWDSPVHQLMPSFSLADPYVTDHVTVGDLYAHRSGLPDHAGDLLEDLGYDRQQVLSRLNQLPLAPFRDSHAYTNFGVTAAAEAVAEASGTDWATLSQQALYGPLGMASTSSRYSDLVARPDRALGHTLVNGHYQVSDPQRQPDAQAPAGGASSSVDDVAKWMEMVLADGSAGGHPVIPPAALLPAISPQSVSEPPTTPSSRAGFSGYGFNVSNTAAGRVQLSHSGAFDMGAATEFRLIPSANVGIVTLTNAAPIGVPETLDAEFADLVQFGSIQQDWHTLYRQAFAKTEAPAGMLTGKTPPAKPAPAQPLPSYSGTYANDYYGPATVTVVNDQLMLALGPQNMTFPLKHWDGDTFVFHPPGENAADGTLSAAIFSGDKLTLEYYNRNGLGEFSRQ